MLASGPTFPSGTAKGLLRDGSAIGKSAGLPAGVKSVAGLLISQILTLYTVPVTFISIARVSRWSSRKVQAKLPAADGKGQEPASPAAD